jgi:hypothetical protein
MPDFIRKVAYEMDQDPGFRSGRLIGVDFGLEEIRDDLVLAALPVKVKGSMMAELPNRSATRKWPFQRPGQLYSD